MSFVHEHGLVKKKKEIALKAPVKDLIRIYENGKVFKKLYIEFAYGKYEFTLPSKAVSRIIEYILLARSFDETTIYDEKTAKKLWKLAINHSRVNRLLKKDIVANFLVCYSTDPGASGMSFFFF